MKTRAGRFVVVAEIRHERSRTAEVFPCCSGFLCGRVDAGESSYWVWHRRAPHLVQKLWNNCHILRDDGQSNGDGVELLPFLLFLKVADEQCRPPFNRVSPTPKGFGSRCW